MVFFTKNVTTLNLKQVLLALIKRNKVPVCLFFFRYRKKIYILIIKGRKKEMEDAIHQTTLLGSQEYGTFNKRRS